MNDYRHFTKTGRCAKCGAQNITVIAVDREDFPVTRAADNVSDSVRWICSDCCR